MRKGDIKPVVLNGKLRHSLLVLPVFQIITNEGWALIMIYIQQTKGLVYSFYAILIVITCLYILLNMTMAILKYKYSQVKKNNVEEEEE